LKECVLGILLKDKKLAKLSKEKAQAQLEQGDFPASGLGECYF
jgi:hypothetical protein